MMCLHITVAIRSHVIHFLVSLIFAAVLISLWLLTRCLLAAHRLRLGHLLLFTCLLACSLGAEYGQPLAAILIVLDLGVLRLLCFGLTLREGSWLVHDVFVVAARCVV
jgi:hypothetical protein